MTQDWSKYVPPERAIELAGKWKHGWIPLDATAVSAKMKGRTGGKRWWDSGGGRAKPAGQVVGKKRRAQSLESSPNETAGFAKQRQTERNRLQRNQNLVAGTKTLNVEQVPGSKPQKRRSGPTAGGKPIDTTKRRLTGDGKAVRTLGNDADTLADNYVRMHGTDGARKKLAALKVNKSKDPRKRELIAALERKVGGGTGKA